MPRSLKSQSSPEESLDNPEFRRRVVLACQRCRLKKCKCDGATPCTRCKSDDTICAYGKHKKSDKTIFRSGYVQMLERQHAQLIAGLQKLYRRTQNGDGWTGPCLEDVNHGQPLTHKILEALGVLQTDEWEDSKSVVCPWPGFEQQGQDNGCIYSETASPSTQAASSPTSPTQTSFLQSRIMSKRRSKAQIDLAPITQASSMPPPLTTTFACVKPEAYNHAFPNQVPTLSDTFLSNEQDNNWIYSETASPSTQAASSPTSPTQTSFLQSRIMSKRRSKAQNDLAPITQTLSMPPPLTTTFACVKPEAYNHAFPNQVPTLSDTFLPNEQMNMGLDRAAGSTIDWSFGMDDLFGNLGGPEQTVRD